MNFVFRWAGWSLSRCFFHLSHHISSAHTHTHTLWRPLSTCKVQVSLSYRSVYLTRCLWSHSADLWRCHSAASDYSWRLSALSSRPPVPLGEHAAVLLHQRTVRFPPPGDLSLAINRCLHQSRGESFRIDDLWICHCLKDWIFTFPGELRWNYAFLGSFAFASGFTQFSKHRCKLLVTLGCHMKPF